jgi:hypothetical protein
MTTDINGTVIAIQGNAVEAGTNGSAQDGYVLTWVNADNQCQLPTTESRWLADDIATSTIG